MAPNDTATPPHGAGSMEVPLKTASPQYNGGRGGSGFKKHVVVDVLLRVLLFATALIGIIVMVTSEQTKQIPVAPGISVTRTAKFSHSPAYM